MHSTASTYPLDEIQHLQVSELRKLARTIFAAHAAGAGWTAFASKAQLLDALTTGNPPTTGTGTSTLPFPVTPAQHNGAPHAASTSTADAAAQIAQILAGISPSIDPDQIRAIVTEQYNAHNGATVENLTALFTTLEASIDQKVRDILAPRVLHITTSASTAAVVLTGVHERFETLARTVSVRNRRSGLRTSANLVGPAGSGKSTAAHQLAEALAAPGGCVVYNCGPDTMTSDFWGYLNASGQYVPSAIYRAVTTGAVLLLDEADTLDPGISKAANTLIDHAARSLEFPCGPVEKHSDLTVICGMNTLGRGADRSYVGGRQQDASTLDRLPVILWGYDERLESSLVAEILDAKPAAAWIKTVRQYRAAAERLGIRTTISPRAAIYGAEFVAAGFTAEEAAETWILSKLSTDERARLEAAAK
jgi:MoxR-like ATPase